VLNIVLGKELAAYIRPHRKLLILAILLAAVSSLFVVIPAYLIQPFVDEGMKTGADPVSWKIQWFAIDPGTLFSWHKAELVLIENVSPNKLLLLLMLIAVISVMFKSIALYLSELSAAAFSNRAVQSLRINLFEKYVSLPLSFHHKRKTGELIARATADLAVMQGNIANILTGLIQHPLTIIVFLGYLIFLNYQLTLLVFVVTPVIVGLIRLFGRKVKKHATRMQDATADVTSAYHEALLCLRVIHGFFKSAHEVKKFSHLAEQLYKKVMRWRKWDLGVGPTMDATVFMVLPGILIIGKVYFHHSLGELVSMLYAFSRMYAPVKKLAKVNNRLNSLQGATKRVFEIMTTTTDIGEPPSPKTLPRHQKSIEFKGVTFSYSPKEPVLKDISFKIKAGEMAAFVGSTGAGKSTLLDLIPRFYDVSGGQITIDGYNIRDVALESLRKQIGIVNQDILLFNNTIAYNIGYGSPRKGMEAITSAAKVSHAHGFILDQPNGYNTIAGNQGDLLSGGQKQRIAIARAILIDPAILILDEAASALDTESERLVQNAIANLFGKRTILVAAHRLSTIMKANHIFVLENGEIVESGTSEELLAINGRFRKLYEMQFKDE
jgi:subfamily B ATP-binding cassette protein MsbA